jgi:glycosyltransferase involved in cell wall biosynthesis
MQCQCNRAKVWSGIKMLERKPQLSVVIPAYNEAERIETTLSNLISPDNRLFNRTCEVLIVMDGCTDNTPQVVKEIIRQCQNATALVFPERLGKGGAIIEALNHTRGDVIAFIDADGSISPAELRKLIELTDYYDLVIGSRYQKNSKLERKRSFKRTVMSRSFNVVSKLLFWRLRNIRDTQCGVKVFSKKLIDAIRNDFLITDFAFDVNLIYSSLSFGFRVKEVGIKWMDKRGSKLSGGLLKHAFVMFVSLLRLRLYYSRFRKILYSKVLEVLGRTFYSWSRSKK